jgi:SAM-dependent methyltransferase
MFLRKINGKVRRLLIGEPTFLDRVVLDKETRKMIESLPTANMDAVEISGGRWSSHPFRSIKSVAYPSFDICEGPLKTEAFDLIIAEQVFEHLIYPYRAAKNVYSMLRPGGYFLISTPFLQKIHNFPVDCSRWTPLGMKHFLSEAGFPIDDINVNSWGNRSAVRARLKARFFPYHNPFVHSLQNEEMFPVQVWALARKAA